MTDRGQPRGSWTRKVVAWLLIIQFFIIVAGVGYFGEVTRREQTAQATTEQRLTEVTLGVIRELRRELNTHAQADASRACAEATMTRYLALIDTATNLTVEAKAKLRTLLKTACSYTLPGGVITPCPSPSPPVPPSVATKAENLTRAATLMFVNALLADYPHKAFTFRRRGAEHPSKKIGPAHLQSALRDRMTVSGPYRLGRWRNGHIIDPGPWKNRPRAIRSFSGRIRDSHIGARWRIRSKSHPRWWLQVGVVKWLAGEQVIQVALGQIGVHYVWGGASPNYGFDCSGFTEWAWHTAVDVHLPHNAEAQRQVCVRVAHPKPGDLVLWDYQAPYGNAATHVGLWLKPGYTIDARNPYNGPVGIRPIGGAPYLMGFWRPRGIGY